MEDQGTSQGPGSFSSPTRQSIQPTYDHRETGDRYRVETWLEWRRVSVVPTRDPFVTHYVTVGWRDLLRGLMRRKLVVEIIVSGDPDIVEDVCELDADYTGRHDSARRSEWRKEVEAGLLGV